MFKTVKEAVDLCEVISDELGIAVVKAGDTWSQPEDKQCPFCGHKDCLKIHTGGNDAGNYHCFSCTAHGDVIKFVAETRKLSSRDAALYLAKKYKISLPNDYSPIQEIFNMAALYYHNVLVDSSKTSYAELNGLSPIDYQIERRGHKLDTLVSFQIGWSDGGLIEYLKGVGCHEDMLLASGLVSKKGNDFLPAKVFVYPHYVRGRVSHFTFKDPLKLKEYQLKNISKLNNHTFYGQDTIIGKETIAIVEGENDLLSVSENGWNEGLLGTIGQLSATQLEWLTLHLKGKKIVTFFDSDPAGDKYREKVGKVAHNFERLTQVKINNGLKDIDEYLVKGGSIQNALDTMVVGKKPEADGEISVSGEGPSSTNIAEKDGCYYKLKFKEGEAIPVKLTNFTIELKNVFIKGKSREREVLLVRQDGYRSSPILFDSESKISLKSFKTLVANAIDGSFYGAEQDLIELWEYVYSNGRERAVYLPPMVGRIEEFKGWLFRDLFITDTGAIIKPDDEGIIWFDNRISGIKATSLDIEDSTGLDIPTLDDTHTAEERKELLGFFLKHLAVNLGDIGLTLSMVGWMKSGVYSNQLFQAVQGFPFLFFWGRHGQGKTVIGKWLASLFNMDEAGYMTLSQYKSGVGWGRKMAYYSSLPLMMDEIRADKNTADLYSNFRSWYQRSSRTLGTKESFGVRTLPIRSTFVFLGQDQFTDAATKQRAIGIRIPIHGREKEKSYFQLMSKLREFSAIGLDWILESTTRDKKEMVKAWNELDRTLVATGCDSRVAKNWAAAGIFAQEMAEEYFPDFDYRDYLLKQAVTDSHETEGDDTIHKFFNIVEGMHAAENPKITGTHISKDGNHLILWFMEIYRQVMHDTRPGSDGETFSLSALREAIKEEDWYIGEDRRTMGVTQDRRRVMIIDLSKAPESLQNLASSI